MRFFLVLFSLHIFCTSVGAQLLILEAQEDVDPLHAQDVSDIACKNLLAEHCSIAFVQHFNSDDVSRLLPLLERSNIVNLSLGFQKPEERVSHHTMDESSNDGSLLEQYNERLSLFHEIFSSYSNTLFVVAAGNGFLIRGIPTRGGVPVSEKFPTQPAFTQRENLIKVAAVEATSFESIPDWTTVRLANYSNYSLTHVDVAAPVESNSQGQLLRGTSFAAPLVSRIARSLSQHYPRLTPQQLTEIFIKSSHVVNIERAIEISLDHQEHGDDSLWSRLEKNQSGTLAQRLALLAEIGPILLVKSGGVVNEHAALACAQNFAEQSTSIEEACLLAQRDILGASPSRIDQLKILWRLREV